MKIATRNAPLGRQTVIGTAGVYAANRFYSTRAEVWPGRNVTAFVRLAVQKGDQT